MASLTKAISMNLFDSILPTYGNQRVNTPSWNDSEKMFICDKYESASGNLYYKGVRFCDRVAIVEKIGQYHTWTYIDGIEIYAFNGKRLELVQKKEYDKVFRNEEFVRSESEALIRDYLYGTLKMQRQSIQEEQIQEETKSIIDKCYKSFLDADFNISLTQIVSQIEQK